MKISMNPAEVCHLGLGQSEPRRLSLYINGRRFIGFGGNWGFSESNLNYRGRI